MRPETNGTSSPCGAPPYEFGHADYCAKLSPLRHRPRAQWVLIEQRVALTAMAPGLIGLTYGRAAGSALAGRLPPVAGIASDCRLNRAPLAVGSDRGAEGFIGLARGARLVCSGWLVYSLSTTILGRTGPDGGRRRMPPSAVGDCR